MQIEIQDNFNLLHTHMLYLHLFLIILAIQVAFFIFAAGLKTDKVTDLAYGITFVLVTLGLYCYISDQDISHMILLGMLAVRWLRLALSLQKIIYKEP